MSRPLIVVTADRDLRAALAFFDGDMFRADTVVDALGEYCDRLGDAVLALGPDVVNQYQGDGLPFPALVLTTSRTKLDTTALAALSTPVSAPVVYLPSEIPSLTRLCSTPAASTPSERQHDGQQ